MSFDPGDWSFWDFDGPHGPDEIIDDANDIEDENPDMKGPAGDFRHCVASCLATRRAGPWGIACIIAWNTGESDDGDKDANWRGAGAAFEVGKSCEEACRSKNKRD